MTSADMGDTASNSMSNYYKPPLGQRAIGLAPVPRSGENSSRWRNHPSRGGTKGGPRHLSTGG